MEMHKHLHPVSDDQALDDDILELLTDSVPDVQIDQGLKSRMKLSVMNRIADEEAGVGAGFETIRANEGEWIEAMPGGSIKILHQEEGSDVLTYLAKLSPGFEMPSHPHPHPEECLMLEGELWLGDLHLKSGDYHFADKGVHHGLLRTETGATVLLKGALPV